MLDTYRNRYLAHLNQFVKHESLEWNEGKKQDISNLGERGV